MSACGLDRRSTAGLLSTLSMEATALLSKGHLFEVLKKDMEAYSLEHKKRLVTSGAYPYAKRILTRAYKDLTMLRTVDPEKYQRIVDGTDPVEMWINNISDAVVLWISEAARAQRGDAYDKRANGQRIKVIRLRQTLSESWQCRDRKGVATEIRTGFPFFLSKTNHRRAADENGYIADESGRGPILVTINPKYLFGPDWAPFYPHSSADQAAPPAENLHISEVLNKTDIVTKRYELPVILENTTPKEEEEREEISGKNADLKGDGLKKPDVLGEETTQRQATPQLAVKAFEFFNEKILAPGRQRQQIRLYRGARGAADCFDRDLTVREKEKFTRSMIDHLEIARRPGEKTWQPALERVKKAILLEAERLADPEKTIPSPYWYLDPSKPKLNLRYALETWVLPHEKSDQEPLQRVSQSDFVSGMCAKLTEKGINISPVQMAKWERTKGRDHVLAAYDYFCDRLAKGIKYQDNTSYFACLAHKNDYTQKIMDLQRAKRKSRKYELWDRADAAMKALEKDRWTPETTTCYQAMHKAYQMQTKELVREVAAYFGMKLEDRLESPKDLVLLAYVMLTQSTFNTEDHGQLAA